MTNNLKTILLLGVLSAILIGFGGLLGRGAVVGFTALAIVINLGAYFFSDKIVLKMHRAEPIDEMSAPRLHAMVHELSLRAGIPKPRLYMIPSDQPNAFATGRNPENAVVAVTSGITRLLNERELRGVLAHEIAHVKNRDILVATIAAAIAGAVSYIANMLQFTALFGGSSDSEEGGSPAGALGLAIVAPIAATLVQLGISRSREFLADESGARISGDPEALASALEKLELTAQVIPAAEMQPSTASLFIVNPFSGSGGLLKLFSTHPSTEERVRRLRAMMFDLSRAA